MRPAACTGVHLNGWVRREDGTKALWVARRSATKQTWPGKLDHLVAGGQAVGITCRDNVIKECAEEAGIPQELASRAIPVSAISYTSLQREGLKRDVLFCYDLELPADFVPQPQVGRWHAVWDGQPGARVSVQAWVCVCVCVHMHTHHANRGDTAAST